MTDAQSSNQKPYGWVYEWPDGQTKFVRGENNLGGTCIPLYRGDVPPAVTPCEHDWSAPRNAHECLKGCGSVMSARTGAVRNIVTWQSGETEGSQS